MSLDAAKLPGSLRIDAAARRVRLDPTDPAFVQDPYRAYAAIRGACPFFFWENYGHWCVMSHAEVGALFRDRRFGRDLRHVATRTELGWPELPAHVARFYAFEENSMLEREPPTHTRLRSLVNRASCHVRWSDCAPASRPWPTGSSTLPASGSFDLLPAFAEPIPVTVIAEMLGVPVADGPQLLDWSHRMVAMYQFGRTRAVEDDAVAATEAFVDYMRGLVARRRGRPGDDILSLLLAAEQDGDRLSEDELITNAILLLNAGHEATVHAIGNGVATLLGLARPLQPLFITPERTAATVEELLRIAPPLHMFTRYALQPLEIDGVGFRTGDKIGLLIGAANRDPAVYAAPSRFDPDRSAVPHVAFGAGIHFCIGAPLARLELQIALPILFDRLPQLRLNEPPRFADRYHFHGLEALRLHV